MEQTVPGAVDWEAWARRWEDQQQWHIPRREQRFRIMLEMVAEIAGPEPRTILDLACGPGSISRRVLERFPQARVVALDADPFLLEIGRQTLGDAGGRRKCVHADLRDPAWHESVAGHAPFDAVLTATALHWLAPGDLVRVYGALADLIREAGVFFNAEHILVAPSSTRLGRQTQELRGRLWRAERPDGESWDEWWNAARDEQAFGRLLAERDTVFNELHPRHDECLTSAFHVEALSVSGFSEAAVVWRFLDDTIVGAIR